MQKHSLLPYACALVLLASFGTAHAVRYQSGDPLRGKLAVSIFAGGGVPLGDFRDVNRGNHKAGVTVALDLEHYVSGEVSVGLGIWGGVYDDRTFGDLVQSTIVVYGGFLKYTMDTDTDVYPYVKFGIGAAELEFEEPGVTFEVDTALALLGGFGVMWRVWDQVSLNGQVSYNYAYTKDKDVPALNALVTFDTQYVGIELGVSFFIF